MECTDKAVYQYVICNIYFYNPSSLPDYCVDFHTEPPQDLLLSSGESPAKNSILTSVHGSEVFLENTWASAVYVIFNLGKFLWVTGVSRNYFLKTLEAVVYGWLI